MTKKEIKDLMLSEKEIVDLIENHQTSSSQDETIGDILGYCEMESLVQAITQARDKKMGDGGDE